MIARLRVVVTALALVFIALGCMLIVAMWP